MILENGAYDVPQGKVAEVVTHLEMTSRPAPRKVPDLPDLELTLEESLARDWYLSLYRKVGADWIWFGRLAKPEAELDALLAEPKLEIYALRQNGTPLGLLELDFRNDGECELSYFGLAPELVGTGAGRWLMDKAIARAFSQPITRFHVHTCTNDSPQALAFYIRSGFTPTRRQVEIADDPRLLGHYPRSAAPQIPILE